MLLPKPTFSPSLCIPPVQVFPGRQFPDLGKGFCSLEISLLSRGAPRVEQRVPMLTINLSSRQELGMEAEGEVFYFSVMSQDPFLYFADQEANFQMPAD